MSEDLQELVEAYGDCSDIAQLPDGEDSTLIITGASLPYGGLYDINKNWTNAHKNHRAGEDADIGLTSLKSDQEKLACLYNAIQTVAALQMPVPNETIYQDESGTTTVGTDNAGTHVHLWSGEATSYEQDLSTEFFEQTSCINYPRTCQ